MKTPAKLILFAATFVAGNLSAATILYDLDFTGLEIGAYSTVFGHPTVQSVGPFTDALIFHAVIGYDQINLAIGGKGTKFNISYDVLVHNLLSSKYSFSMILDTPEVRNVYLHGGLKSIGIYQPSSGGLLGGFLNDQVYHFDVSVDLTANLWTVAIDGTQKYAQPVNASALRSIRFNMSPWQGGASDAPGTYAALDNVVVTVVPEPVSGVLSICGAALVFSSRSPRAKQGEITRSKGTMKVA